MAHYLVTGATGFIGAEVVKQLVGRGHRVSAFVRGQDDAPVLKALGVVLRQGDVRDRASIAAAMAGVDGVFHLAARHRIGTRDPEAARVTVEGTRNVLGVLGDLGIARGVYVSTIAVLGDTQGAVVDETYERRTPFLTGYERAKWQAHFDVALPLSRAGLPLVIAMPGAVYGPGDRSGIHAILVRLLRRRLFAVPSGTAFSWGYIEDTARGLIDAMERGRPGESYLLTGPAHTFEEAMVLAARIARVRAPLVRLPPGVMRPAAAFVHALELLGLRDTQSSEALRVMAGVTWLGSSAKAQREIGFRARALRDGLAPTIEYERRMLRRR